MADGYTGWKLFDKVTIVARKILAYDYKTGETTDTGNVQGYLVDPTNKKQLEAARNWGTTYKNIYQEVDGKLKYVDREIIEPEEYTYDNDGFTLELHNSAEGSSQGGKLSFWNCWITAPDGTKFLIGIAADLLLDVLKNNTVINGVVQEKLLFARRDGGVGMLSKNMNSYQNAIKELDEGLKFEKGDVKPKGSGVYSYMVDSTISEVVSDLQKDKKMSASFATNYLYYSGLKIYSTQNSEIQKDIEEELEKQKYMVKSTKYSDKTTQGAMVVIDHQNGQVKGCVGGLGEKKVSRGFNRVTQALRQTGSAIKPIAVLGPALEEKIITPVTVYDDRRTIFNNDYRCIWEQKKNNNANDK